MSRRVISVTRRRATHGMSSRRLVLIAFTLVGVMGVPLVTLLAAWETWTLERQARDIANDMLTSVRLLGKLENAVQKKQNLVGEHILATGPAATKDIEADLAATDKLIEATMQAYDQWTTLPGERDTWDRMLRDLRDVDRATERALALSRVDRDSEARTLMKDLVSRFARVTRDFEELISINDRGARESLSRISAIRFRVTTTLVLVGLLGLMGMILLGQWVARHVARRENEAAREAIALKERNRELDAFAGRVAHDIRGPLTTINLVASRLQAKVPEQHRATDVLRRGVHRLQALVDDLLTLARIEGVVPGRCDPAVVAAQLKEDFAERIERARGQLRVAVDHCAVSCSEGLLRQALANLAENAVKYRRAGVPLLVDISGGRSDGGYDLRVSDNGEGIAAEEAARIFEPLYRSPRTQEVPGSGLGLSIVKRVASASGGTVAVETRLGQGTTFVVHLPVASGEIRTEGGAGA